MESGDWCLIESDPGVFTELIKKFGVKGVQVEEMWTIDEGICENLKPIHGLIFLFKYVQHEEPSNTVVTDERLENIYFAKQVINNACATQALVTLLLNCNHPDVCLGPELTQLKEFSMSLDPTMRGLTLSNSQMLRTAHNSMAQPTLFGYDPKTATKEEDANHFIGYMPINGRLYELDGLRDGPIDHGPIAPEQDWLDVVRPIIIRRTLTYSCDEIHFNLMALVSDRKMVYERKIDELTENAHSLGMETDEIENEIRNLQMLIEQEDIKTLRNQQEMVRRKHNYLPFIMTLLQILAEEKKLMPMYRRAKERASVKAANKLSEPSGGRKDRRPPHTPRRTSPSSLDLDEPSGGRKDRRPPRTPRTPRRTSLSSPSRVLPPSEQERYSLADADLDAIFTEPHSNDSLPHTVTQPLPEPENVFAPDDFKDVVMQPGPDADLELGDISEIFDGELPGPDDVLEPDDFFVNSLLRDPKPEAQPDCDME